MVGTVIGIKSISFTDDKTQRVISGQRLYVEYADPDVAGLACDAKFIASDGTIEHPASFVLGQKYDFVMQEQGFSGKARLVKVVPYKG